MEKNKLSGLLKNISSKKHISWIDKLSFIHILVFWIILIVFFGLFYYLAIVPSSSLNYSSSETPVNNLYDAIYFSFVSATTTGFGDIVPVGLFRVVAIVEVIFGLLLLALVTSRLVSIRQDAILNEVYEISFNEKVNRLRSSLLLFRQNLDRLISKSEEKTFGSREARSLNGYVFSLEDTLSEIFAVINKKKGNKFIKKLDPVNTELIFNSMISSFNKLDELFIVLIENKISFKKQVSFSPIKKCFLLVDSSFSQIGKSSLSNETIDDLNKRINSVLESLRKKAYD
jgi:hypothetical protein